MTKKTETPSADDHVALHVASDELAGADALAAAISRVDVDFPDRPHPYALPGYPNGETMTMFKKRRAAAKAAARKKEGKPVAPKAFVLADSVPPALRQLVSNGILTKDEVKAAACLARDYDLGYRSSIRTTAYEERVGSGGGHDRDAIEARVIDARQRFDQAKAAVDDRLWVYVFAVVIERVERINVSGIADRYKNEKLRRAASAVTLVTGLSAVADWYRVNGWGGRA